jgi:hypothetical protein
LKPSPPQGQIKSLTNVPHIHKDVNYCQHIIKNIVIANLVIIDNELLNPIMDDHGWPRLVLSQLSLVVVIMLQSC